MLAWLGIVSMLFVSGGATCSRRQPTTPFPPPPVVFSVTPSLQDLTTTVNRTQNIRQLSSNSASVEMLSMPNLPRLGATLNLERERKFRLRASLPIVFTGVDMGSNDEVFWFEVPEGMSKTLYYARHDEYQQQLTRAILPVDPTWIMDALGLVQLDPATVIAGPITRSDGKLEIRNTIQMPDGTYQRVCFIDAGAGFVTDQFLYSPSGNLIARSAASQHVFYPEPQCAIPHRVEVHLAPAVGPPLSMRIEVASYAINQLLSGDSQLFTMPTSAPQSVNLTTLGGTGPTAVPPPIVSAPVSYSASVETSRPLRGIDR
jgi:hypothetical protein